MKSFSSRSLASSSPTVAAPSANAAPSSLVSPKSSVASSYSESSIRSLSLAQAAISHALYFLELDAQAQAASYCDYAAEHLKEYIRSVKAPLCDLPEASSLLTAH